MTYHTQAVRKLTIKPEWAELVRKTRRQLKETQEQFGARFGVSGVTVSYWERGIYDLPGEVTWWLSHRKPAIHTSPTTTPEGE